MKYPSAPPPATEPEPRSSSFLIKIPAILAIAFCLVLGVSFHRWNSAALILRYREIAGNALEKKDYQTAIVAANRLLSFGGESRNDALFKLALVNLGLGHKAEALGILKTLAPPDRPVFAPAHLFIAKMLSAGSFISTETKATIVAQLRNVLILQPDSAEARELLSRYQN